MLRFVLQALLVAGLCVLPTIGTAEILAGLHRRGAWLPDVNPHLFDKVMDFLVGPLFTILLVVALILGARWIDRRDWRDLGLRLNRRWAVEFGLGLMLGALLIALVVGAEMMLGWVRIEPRGAPALLDVPMVLLWAFIVLKTLCVGVSEEFVSRGYVLKNVAEGMSGLGGLSPVGAAAAAALLTSVLFAAGHAGTDNFSMASLAGLTVNGILLVIPVLLTGRLAASMGLHMSWNFTQGAIFGYPVSGDSENISWLVSTAVGPERWTGGSYGPEAGYLGIASMAVGAILILAYAKLHTGQARIVPQIAIYRPLRESRHDADPVDVTCS